MLLYFVFTKIPFAGVAALWKKVNIFFLLAASFLFLLSQILSAKRLEMFLKAREFNLSFRSNLALYFVGMFYNFFIPGGVGGDAYKVYLLHKKFGWGAKQITASLFTDRLNGLVAIGIIICFLAFILLNDFRVLLVVLLVVGIFISFFLVRKLFPNYHSVFWKALPASLAVQVLQVFSFIFLLKSIGITTGFVAYSLLFLASSVLSLVSFAGIGVREMLFLQASKFFDFSPEYSVSASLLFTLITAFFSLWGLFFQLRTLNLKTTDQ